MRQHRKRRVSKEITVDELLSNTEQSPTGCLLWVGASDLKGYGHIARNKKKYIVTRLMMHLTSGFDLTNRDLFVLHSCDTPRCINPNHLRIGTRKDNAEDAVKKRRHQHGETHSRAKFSAALIRQIRADYTLGISQGELVQKYGIDQGYLSRIVNHRVRTLN